jgi:hypothetical protein
MPPVQQQIRFGRLPQRLPGWAGWSLVGALLLIEFLLFRHYLHREVLWAYPPNTDQVGYLSEAYDTYESMKSRGIVRALEALAPIPQGALMRVQAGVFFLVAGASRESALDLNFAWFAIFQCAIVWAVRWLAGRWDGAWAALGLLLSAATPFLGPGGIADFRMDFIAFCLYGSLLCVVIRSGVFANWRWAPAIALMAAALIGFRFIAAVYVGGALGCLGLLFVVRLFSRDAIVRRTAVRRCSSLLLTIAIIALLVAPMLWANRAAIHDYYWVNHVTGPEKQVRAAEAGASGWAAALAYYPRSLLWGHAGPAFLLLAGALLLGATLVRLTSNPLMGGNKMASRLSCSLSLRERAGVRGNCGNLPGCSEVFPGFPSPQPARGQSPIPLASHGGRGSKTASPVGETLSAPDAIPGGDTAAAERRSSPLDHGLLSLAWAASAAFLLAPLVVLTLDISKSPVVASIMVGPLAWGLMLGITTMLRGRFPTRPTLLAFALGLAALAAVGWGVRTQAAAYSRDRFMSQHRRDVRQIERLYDDVATESRRRGWNDVGVFCTAKTDCLDGQLATVLAFERHGQVLHAGDLTTTVLEIPEPEVFRQIAASHFVILARRLGPPPPFDYPFNKELEAMRPRVQAVCERDMTEIGRYRFYGREVRLFVRRESR